MQVRKVSAQEFFHAFGNAYRDSPDIAAACSSPYDLREALLTKGGQAFLTKGGMAGFIVMQDGELTGLYSVIKGQGDDLVQIAVQNGARKLDCFEWPKLVALYERHGFLKRKREKNWNGVGPNVVYMSRETGAIID